MLGLATLVKLDRVTDLEIHKFIAHAGSAVARVASSITGVPRSSRRRPPAPSQEIWHCIDIQSSTTKIFP